MSIRVDSTCLECFLTKNLALARSLGDEEQTMAYFRELMKIWLSAPEGSPVPWIEPQVNALRLKMYGLDPDRYREEKILSNQFVLERMDMLRSRVAAAEDPVYAALQFAVLGNFIDYSAFHGHVDFEKLDAMLEEGSKLPLDREMYTRMCEEMAAGRRFVYLTDNAGEIGFDRILAEELQKKYPHLEITFCVRGGVTANDATREDAAAVGIPFPVIDSGCAIAGTFPERISPETKQVLETADVILAKGMANAETMLGCGWNVYYALLIKCKHLADAFGKPLMTPVLIRE